MIYNSGNKCSEAAPFFFRAVEKWRHNDLGHDFCNFVSTVGFSGMDMTQSYLVKNKEKITNALLSSIKSPENGSLNALFDCLAAFAKDQKNEDFDLRQFWLFVDSVTNVIKNIVESNKEDRELDELIFPGLKCLRSIIEVHWFIAGRVLRRLLVRLLPIICSNHESIRRTSSSEFSFLLEKPGSTKCAKNVSFLIDELIFFGKNTNEKNKSFGQFSDGIAKIFCSAIKDVNGRFKKNSEQVLRTLIEVIMTKIRSNDVIDLDFISKFVGDIIRDICFNVEPNNVDFISFILIDHLSLSIKSVDGVNKLAEDVSLLFIRWAVILLEQRNRSLIIDENALSFFNIITESLDFNLPINVKGELLKLLAKIITSTMHSTSHRLIQSFTEKVVESHKTAKKRRENISVVMQFFLELQSLPIFYTWCLDAFSLILDPLLKNAAEEQDTNTFVLEILQFFEQIILNKHPITDEPPVKRVEPFFNITLYLSLRTIIVEIIQKSCSSFVDGGMNLQHPDDELFRLSLIAWPWFWAIDESPQSLLELENTVHNGIICGNKASAEVLEFLWLATYAISLVK